MQSFCLDITELADGYLPGGVSFFLDLTLTQQGSAAMLQGGGLAEGWRGGRVVRDRLAGL